MTEAYSSRRVNVSFFYSPLQEYFPPLLLNPAAVRRRIGIVTRVSDPPSAIGRHYLFSQQSPRRAVFGRPQHALSPACLPAYLTDLPAFLLSPSPAGLTSSTILLPPLQTSHPPLFSPCLPSLPNSASFLPSSLPLPRLVQSRLTLSLPAYGPRSLPCCSGVKLTFHGLVDTPSKATGHSKSSVNTVMLSLCPLPSVRPSYWPPSPPHQHPLPSVPLPCPSSLPPPPTASYPVTAKRQGSVCFVRSG